MHEYNRKKAVEYALYWALRRNPRYYDFENIGGDCTNYASQCIYAGAGVMNFKPTYGWYYVNLNNRAPAWTSVKYLHQFLTTNKGAGPFASEVDISEVMLGDVIQLKIDRPYFHHSPVVTQIDGAPSLDTIRVSAHSYDSRNRPLSDYDIKEMRCLHIEGYRK